MRKHYILVYPDKPYEEGLDKHQMHNLLLSYEGRAEQIELPSADSVKLPGGLLLLERETADTVLRQIYYAADKSALTVKLRFLSED